MRERLMKRKAERNAEVVRLKDSGMSYKQIAEKFGIGKARAYEIYRHEKREESLTEMYGHFLTTVSPRTRNCLRRAHIWTVDDLYEFAKEGRHLRGVGPATIDEINGCIDFKVKLGMKGRTAVIMLAE